VTAVGGLLAAALTAFGSSSTLLPGVQTDRFALLSALWASLAVIAPVVIGFMTTTHKEKRQTAVATTIPLWALFVALWVILLAAGAELTTLIVLLSESALNLSAYLALDIVLGLFGVLIGLYVVQTTRTLAMTQEEATGPHSSLNSALRTSLLP
jgi:lysylphosphatidylglycerol synthetase-like protein (DUF2156 family)